MCQQQHDTRWSGHAADVARAEAAERRLGLRKAIQRALVLGRLYGGGAIIIGTGERDPAALACPLDEDWLRPGGLKFLHVVSRWQLGAAALSSDPLSPWCGEPALYELAAAGRAPLMLHPSRVVRFLGNPLPDPWAVATPWSDSVLQALYDAVHATALTVAGATSLMHEAKVDVVTVPNLSEHLSSAETTDQLSARFAYAAAMKSINNLLLLGDGETWSRQSVDLGGLPEMVRCFLQVAAGAADIPVTRLLGQSPSGLSATGESDTRNYYDMIAARQELDLRPQLERLDRLMLRSEGFDPAALTFSFRPLWQLDAASAAAIALQKAQATQIYAGLKLWPAAVTARLVEAQLVQDGTYPNAAAVFAEGAGAHPLTDSRGGTEVSKATGGFWTEGSEPRNWHGRWTGSAGVASHGYSIQVAASTTDPMAGGDPNIEENLEKIEKKEHPLIRIGPSIAPRENPDGTVEFANPGAAIFIGVGPKAASPKLPDVPGKQKHPDATNTSPPTGTIASELKPGPTMASPGSPSKSAPNIQVPVAKPDASAESVEALFGEARPAKTLKTPDEIAAHPFVRALKAAIEGDRETLEACKMELPPDIARRLIPGVIGPGPWATQPIRVPFGKEATKKMRTMVPDDGSPNRCHICGALTLTPNGGLLSLDHQPPQALNLFGEDYDLYRHCKTHYSSQGGFVKYLINYMRQEGLKP